MRKSEEFWNVPKWKHSDMCMQYQISSIDIAIAEHSQNYVDMFSESAGL